MVIRVAVNGVCLYILHLSLNSAKRCRYTPDIDDDGIEDGDARNW